jgi:hypothetical protein
VRSASSAPNRSDTATDWPRRAKSAISSPRRAVHRHGAGHQLPSRCRNRVRPAARQSARPRPAPARPPRRRPAGRPPHPTTTMGRPPGWPDVHAAGSASESAVSCSLPFLAQAIEALSFVFPQVNLDSRGCYVMRPSGAPRKPSPARLAVSRAGRLVIAGSSWSLPSENEPT